MKLFLQKDRHKPFIIAGPCSAETEEQVFETAKQLRDIGIDLMRAGIWKPRTRPGNFEGVGSIGLEWLQRVRKEFGLKVTVEVASPRHVEEALTAGVDVLWLGARTSANPFAVQEIADALTGICVPVLVKNPVNPDVSLWVGAIERVAKSVSDNVGAIHRGVTQYEKTIYRNKPEWGLSIELRKYFPDILLLADPSHIAGNSELICKISQTALDLKFDGLMIETHLNPEKAWSDKQQQITPAHLQQILSRLTLREEQPEGARLKTLEDLRKSIDFIDTQLIDMLSYRMDIVEELGQFKKLHGMTIFQEERWKELISMHIQKAEEHQIDVEFVLRLFNIIHQQALDRQNEIVNGVN